MSWTEATFTNRSGKRQQVWVKTDDVGEIVVTDGRVAMKYDAGDDAKIYNPSPRNIAVGDDEDQSGASRPNGRKKRSGGKKSGSKKRPKTSYDELIWKQPEGTRVVNHEPPAGLENVERPPGGVIDAWTDGACTGNPGPAGYGVVLLFDEEYLEIGQYIGNATNNIGELLAIRVALEEARNIEGKLRIHTDSSYSIGVLTKGWKAKANVELIESIRAIIADYDNPPKFVKVKGHAGIPLNERADALAVDAVERRK